MRTFARSAVVIPIAVAIACVALLGASLPGLAEASPSDDVPRDLVVDFRIYEMRSSSPNFRAMSDLSFFVNTDGAGVTEAQWLATIARQVPDAFLASLAFETVPVSGTTASFTLARRSRTFGLELDLGGYVADGTFAGTLAARLERSDEVIDAFTKDVELRHGQTMVMSSGDLEISSSDYLSHFRDYADSDHRGDVYSYLRNYTMFLIVAATLRLAPDGAPERMDVSVPDDAEVPELVSPAPVRLVGTIVLEFDVDVSGAPQEIRIARSSIPEVNPRIVGEVSSWRFPEAAGRPARLELELEASP